MKNIMKNIMKTDCERYIALFGPGLRQNCEKFCMELDFIDFMWDDRLGRLVYDATSKKFLLCRAKSRLRNSEMELIYTVPNVD